MKNTMETTNTGYFIGCFLTQGLLYVVCDNVILTERPCRDSVVSLLGEEGLASYSDTACISGIWRELKEQCKGIIKHIICA